MIIVKLSQVRTRGRSEMEPRGTVMTFVYDKSARHKLCMGRNRDKNIWRDKVTFNGSDGGS